MLVRECASFKCDVIFQRSPGYFFSLTATAQDRGEPPRSQTIDLSIRVVESHKKAPTFSYIPTNVIRLKENFRDYEASIARLEAQSNIEDSPDYFLFELVTGRTEQANKDNTFRWLFFLTFFQERLFQYFSHK